MLTVAGGSISVSGNTGTARQILELTTASTVATIKASFQGSSSFGDLAFQTSSSERMRILANGNVGIGTTSPTAKSHVYGGSSGATVSTNSNLLAIESNGNNGLQFLNPSANNANINFGDPSNNEIGFIQYQHATDAMRFRAGGTTILNLVGGNVGIGTASPSAKLDVSITSGNAWMNLINGSETAFRLTTYNNGTGNGTNAYAFKHGLYYSTTENAAVTFYRGGSSTGGFLTFTTNAGSERMRIDSSGDVLMGNTAVNIASNFNNQKGFGFDFSTGQTEIATTANAPTLTLGRNLGTDGSILDLRKQATVIGSFGSNTTGGQTLLDISASASNGNMRFLTSGAERIRITSSGNVGIGITTPHSSSKLHVNGQIRAGSGATFTQGGSAAAVVAARNFGYGANSPQMNGSLTVVNTNTAGTAGYISLAAHYGNTNNTIYQAAGIGGGKETAVGNGQWGGYLNFFTTSDGSAGAASGAFEHMRITADGKVGIGFASPNAKLEIHQAQVTTQFDRDCFLRLTAVHPTATTNSGGFTNIMFGTSTTNNYGVAIGGKRAGTDDTPSFSIRMLNDAITGTEVLNITNSGNATFAGSVTVGGNLILPDASSSSQGIIFLGASNDLQIYHDGSDSYIRDLGTGELRISGSKTRIYDADLSSLQAEFTDGGSVDLYYDSNKKFATTIDGIQLYGNGYLDMPDNGRIRMGASYDFAIYHDGFNSYINNATGDLYIQQNANDKDLVFQCDDGSGGSTSYITLDGNDVQIRFDKNTRHSDGIIALFGSGNDLQIFHDGSNSYIQDTGTGNLNIKSNSLRLLGADSSSMLVAHQGGAVNLYHNNSAKLETTSTGIYVGGNIQLLDSSSSSFGRITFGNGTDLQIYHNGSHSYIDEVGTGNLYIRNGTNNSIWCQTNGAVQLYYNNSSKLATASTGVAITGELSATTGSFNNGVGNGSGPCLSVGGSGDIQASSGGSLFFGAYNYGASTYIRGHDSSTGLQFFADGQNLMNMTSSAVSISSLVISSSLNMGSNSLSSSGTITCQTLAPTGFINLDNSKFITFYGDNSPNHGIGAVAPAGGTSTQDDLRINSYAAVCINLDSNNNNTSNANFIIGRHGGATGNATSSTLLTLNGENGTLSLTGSSGDLDADGLLYAKALRTHANTTSYSLITRNTAASNYVLYVQSPNSGGTQKIATFRYGSASAGGGTEVMKIARGDCNIYEANLTVAGSITGNSKNFSIKHPTKQGKRLVHSCLEGPEVAVYFRGRSKSNIIEMPDYWGGLVHLDSMTVELTAIGPNQDLYVEDIADDGEVTVGSNTETPLNYFYVVYGERKDIDKLEVEIHDTGEVEGKA